MKPLSRLRSLLRRLGRRRGAAPPAPAASEGPEAGNGPGSSGRWSRVVDLLNEALERPEEDRGVFLQDACADDPGLRDEVASLLEAHGGTGRLDELAELVAPRRPAPSPTVTEGDTLGHYRILDRLGRGGMGVVYRARDTRLDRTVALKFLPWHLGADPGAREHLLAEARAAAALDHPNICTVHEIAEGGRGRMFIAMAFYEGETVKAKLARGRRPVEEVLDWAIQATRGLARAHGRGIIHRDIKPANLMVTAEGGIRILDFGLARMADATLSASPAPRGTAAYMSPEQARGDRVDPRTDLWSLGVVLYEALAGERPFPGDSAPAILRAILEDEPEPLGSLCPELPDSILRIVAKTVARRPEDRYESAAALRRDLEAVDPAARRSRRSPALGIRPLSAVVLALLLLAGTAWTVWSFGSGDDVRLSSTWTTSTIAEIEGLAEEGRYLEAYRLTGEAEARGVPDTALAPLWSEVSDRLSVTTEPEGARVYASRFVDDGPPRAGGEEPTEDAAEAGLLGTTPVENLRIPRVDHRLRFEKEGYAPTERLASSRLARSHEAMGVSRDIRMKLDLVPAGGAPGDMVFVPGGGYELVSPDVPAGLEASLGAYFLDRFEVSNERFREFVTAGGYGTHEHWPSPVVADGDTLSFADVRERLVDRTGLPGPRGWMGQEYPDGRGGFPVTGITWYEAAAYCGFRGKRLPTVFQWEKAARAGRTSRFTGVVMPWGYVRPGARIGRRANFNSSGTMPVDAHPFGMSPYGAYAMAGNAKEWMADPVEEGRAVTGGSWEDPMYLFSEIGAIDPSSSSTSLGFRCARPRSDTRQRSDDPGAAALRVAGRPPAYRPVDESTFRSLLSHYQYDPRPPEAEVLERVETGDWIRQKVSYDGPAEERVLAYLWLPRGAAPPFQTLAYVPGVDAFYARSVPEAVEWVLGPIIRSGRAVFAVVMEGMVEREWGPEREAPQPGTVRFRDLMVRHATELRLGLDYLEGRDDMDMDALAYAALSWGSGSRLGFAAVDDRFDAVILIGGGIDERMKPTLPAADNVNFAPYIRPPKLLLNGRHDEEHPWLTRGLPLWNLLREPKDLVLVEGAGHVPPLERRIPAINDWLDDTVGPVSRSP